MPPSSTIYSTRARGAKGRKTRRQKVVQTRRRRLRRQKVVGKRVRTKRRLGGGDAEEYRQLLTAFNTALMNNKSRLTIIPKNDLREFPFKPFVGCVETIQDGIATIIFKATTKSGYSGYGRFNTEKKYQMLQLLSL